MVAGIKYLIMKSIKLINLQLHIILLLCLGPVFKMFLLFFIKINTTVQNKFN
mgnify:CR=1 FL=1